MFAGCTDHAGATADRPADCPAAPRAAPVYPHPEGAAVEEPVKSVGHGGYVLLWFECSDSPSLTQRQRDREAGGKVRDGSSFCTVCLHALCQKIGTEGQ